MNSDFFFIVLSNDQIALLKSTIADFEVGGSVRKILTRATPVKNGNRIRATADELDDLLGAISVEVRGFLRIDEERAGRELEDPLPGSTASRLASLYDLIEKQLS